MNELERNSKKYIKAKFHFLTENGYKLKYYFKNGEELFDFNKDDIHVYIFNESQYVDCTFSNTDTIESNIRTIAGDSFTKQFDTLANIEKVDYLASLVETYLNTIEGNKYNYSKEKKQYLMLQTEKLKCIKQVIDEVDPLGLLKIGSPKDEYEQEALLLAKEVVGVRITWKKVESIFHKQFGEKLPKKVCKTIAYKIVVQLEYADLFKEFYQNELLTDKVTLKHGSIVLKVHDNFIVEYICGRTYINEKFYSEIEDQDLLERFCEFVTDDKTVYVQYTHKHLGFHYEHPFRYFKEVSKRNFSLEKLKRHKDIELVFDNKQVIYTAKDYSPYMDEQQLEHLLTDIAPQIPDRKERK